MLAAYFDESYNHRTARNPKDPLIYTVAGCLSTVARWKKFEKQWQLELNLAGVSAFHMKDYEARQGEYRDWSNEQRVRVLKRLHKIIKGCMIYGCAASLNCADFDEKIGSTPRLANHFGKTYYDFDVRLCVKELNEWCDRHQYTDKMLYVFSELNRQGSALDRMFREVLASPALTHRYRTNDRWVKGSMKECVPLQAADILAYELNKRAVNSASGGAQFVRKSLYNLRLSRGFLAAYFARDNLSSLIIDSFAKPAPLDSREST